MEVAFCSLFLNAYMKYLELWWQIPTKVCLKGSWVANTTTTNTHISSMKNVTPSPSLPPKPFSFTTQSSVRSSNSEFDKVLTRKESDSDIVGVINHDKRISSSTVEESPKTTYPGCLEIYFMPRVFLFRKCKNGTSFQKAKVISSNMAHKQPFSCSFFHKISIFCSEF